MPCLWCMLSLPHSAPAPGGYWSHFFKSSFGSGFMQFREWERTSDYMTEYERGHMQQCSAALRRCYSIQAKINDLRSNPATPNISPKKTPADLAAPPASKPGSNSVKELTYSTCLQLRSMYSCPSCIYKVTAPCAIYLRGVSSAFSVEDFALVIVSLAFS